MSEKDDAPYHARDARTRYERNLGRLKRLDLSYMTSLRAWDACWGDGLGTRTVEERDFPS
jgi:hypothetical protein